MWHEARKHERKIRGMIVDYKKRAERRREFYEKIRRDPAQFLQIHGRLAKIHVDASISSAAENCLVPWHGDENNTIDRFDVRAHLDSLDFGPPQPATKSDKRENDEAERRINYERWRNLIQNEFLGISEARCLHQIWLEERYGGNQSEETTTQKKKKAVFAYNYENPEETRNSGNEDELSEDGTDSEEDIDSSIDIKTLTADQVIRMNGLAAKYDLMNDDFIRFAEEDLAEAERIRIAKALESEKSMFSGRKSRRERRALKERCMLIVRANNVAESLKQTQGSDEETASKVESSSQSEDSEVEERKIEFITSFGGSSEDESKTKSKKKSTVKTSKKKTKSSKPVAVVEPAPAVEFGPSMPPEIEEKLFGPTKESSPSPGFSPRRSTLYRSKSRSPIRPDPRSVYGWKRRSPSSPSSLSSFEKSRRRSRSGSRRRSSHHRSSRRSNSRTRSRVSHKDDKSSSSESIPSRYRIRKSRSRSRSRSRSYSRHRRRFNGRKRSRNHRSRSRSHSTRRRSRYSYPKLQKITLPFPGSSSSSSSSPHRSRRRSKSRSRGRSPRYSSSHKHRHHRHRRRSSSNKPTSSRHSRRSSKEPKRRKRSSSNSSSSRSSSHESLTFKYKRDRIVSSKNISGHSSSDENSKKKPNSIPQPTKHDDVPKGGDPTSVASNPSVPPLRKYYRDDLDEDSDSSLSVDESSSSRKPPQIEPSKSNSTKAGVSSVKSSADRLKRKTQALLERQCKLDKAQERKRR